LFDRRFLFQRHSHPPILTRHSAPAKAAVYRVGYRA
jgi:hypothetical protein